MGITVSNPDLDRDSDLTAIANLTDTGLIARTGSGTAAARALTGPAAGLTVTNGGGVAGNPTLALANDLAALEALASTGLAARTGTDTWAQRSIAVGSGLAVANGNGASGNPTISLAQTSWATALAAALGANWATALAADLDSPWAAYLAQSPLGSDPTGAAPGFYTNHATLGGFPDAVAWRFGDRIMFGDAALESLTPGTVFKYGTGIVRSGTTATFTSDGAHGLSTGDQVQIVGALQSAYNVVATITVTSPTTFTYTVAGSPTTPATTTSCFQVLKITAGVNEAVTSWIEKVRPTSVRAAHVALTPANGQITFLAVTQSLNWPYAGTEACIGISGTGVNNNVTQVQTVWGYYGEGQRHNGAGATFFCEGDSVNWGSEETADLHDIHPDPLTVTFWAASGGGYYGTNAATAAYAVVDNGDTYINGIIGEATALKGCDGAGSGAATWMRMACGWRLDWEYASNTLGSRIWSAVTSATNALAQKFTNSGFELTSLDDATQYYQLGKTYAKTRAGTGLWLGSGMSATSQDPTYMGSLRLFDNGGVSGGGGLEFMNPFYGAGYGFRLIAPDLGGGQTPLITQRRSNSASWSEGTRLTASGGLIPPRLSSDPTAEDEGEFYFNTTTKKHRAWTGSAWVDMF